MKREIVKLINEKGVLIKISGGALATKLSAPYAEENVKHIVNEICMAYEAMENPKIAVVVGGGNIWRGYYGKCFGIKAASSDEIGIYATITNALLISKEIAQRLGEDKVRLMLTRTAVPTEVYNREEAIKALSKGKVVILGGGIGEPFVSTDFAAVSRAAALELGMVLMAKDGVNGVYNRDPNKEKARKYATLNYNDFIVNQLKVADILDVQMAKDTQLPLFFFDFSLENALKQIIEGKACGTLVSDVETSFEE